jgi:Flp pilus assembly protein TadD
MTDKLMNETLRTGIEQLDAGNTKAAIATLKGYCQAHQNDPDSWFYYGDALAEDGRIDEAIERYREGLKLAP